MLASIGSITFIITPSMSVCVVNVNFSFLLSNSLYRTPSVPNKFVLLYFPVASMRSKYLEIPLVVLLTLFAFIIS